MAQPKQTVFDQYRNRKGHWAFKSSAAFATPPAGLSASSPTGGTSGVVTVQLASVPPVVGGCDVENARDPAPVPVYRASQHVLSYTLKLHTSRTFP